MGFTVKFPKEIKRKAAKELQAKLDHVEPTSGSLDLSVVVGREVEESFLLRDLLVKSESNSNQFMALGIVGAAGSGKTTVCQMMFDSPQVQENFLPRIWVCMTKQPGDDPEPKVTVAERMLTCLGEDEEIIKEKRQENGISGLISLLHRQLVGKRYLIVLDDAWDGVDWYQKLDLGFDCSIQHKPNKGKNFTWVPSTDWSQSLAFGLPKGYGGAVIVNGRNDKLVEMMVGKENLHNLLPLADEDCWAIFKKAAGDPELDPQAPQVEELWRDVVQGAGGHPFMAKLMGQCYHGKQLQVKDTAQQAANGRNVSTAEEAATQPASSSNNSSIAQLTGPESAQVTTLEPVDSSNGSSLVQVTGPELAQVTQLQPVDSSNGSSITQVTGPDRPRSLHHNWSIVTRVLRWKNLSSQTRPK